MIKKLTYLILSVFIGINAFGQADIKSETLKNHVYFLASDSLEGRGLATESGLKAAHYIADYFKNSGLEPVGDSFFHTFKARVSQSMLEGRNVVGMVEGSDPVLKNEYIVLGAHYDHISYKLVDGKKVVYNGADDNASGTAAVMEIGRALAKQKGKLKRSVILVAFDGEESGLIGSGKFVKQKTIPVDQIKAMMSIDMIGRYAESKSLIMGAMDDLKGGADRLMPHADEHDVKIKKTGGATSNRTDTKPFGDVGIPAIYVSSGIVGPYHKPEDDRETLDYEGMEKITNMLADLTIDLANGGPLEPVNVVVAENKSKGTPFFRYGIKLNTGGSANIYPNEFYKAKSGLSAEAGLITQLKITKHITLQPEVLYSTLGSLHQTGHSRVHSVTTPVSLLLTSAMNQNGVQERLHASIGGYYSYHFAGAINKVAMDFDNTYEQSEIGIVYGLGLEVMKVCVSVNFKHGFTNIMQGDDNGTVNNRAMYFTLGYMF